MTTIEYDEMSDDFYAKCHDCPWEGRSYMQRQRAVREANSHDDWHEEQIPAPGEAVAA